MGQTETFRAALVQLRSGREIAPNMTTAAGLIREAAARARNTSRRRKIRCCSNPTTPAFSSVSARRSETAALGEFGVLAQELGVWLHIGSLAIRVSEGKAANRSYVFAPKRPDRRTL